ncbi:Elongator complex protein 3 [Auxenochlorella protothecoides]|uniref:Elongator complex protein 3 n=1 Tax=Auxenochlorella protothecoides TaxID=3075 RepID=A0A087SD11_AUXPR|nr:Elongator complex protein 3 [Auxenochlorella protothecoides]KFM23615.1 Elongator complex protein 3 [Auxenochlorella protothecoides]RMZ52037.1 hypothetical protein APUTEX25_001231 [Auxenochlorella protothecoides]|eukprot:RMZ52037.1 hypothetical protein APUTEX25_001231 [Auxenochlorella protothecoides]
MAVTETEKRPSMRMARNKKGNVVLDPAEVVAHMMPDLPNVGWERDLESFREYFENPAFRSDGLKLYPTLVIRGTGLYELWKQGLYRNYQPEKVLFNIGQPALNQLKQINDSKSGNTPGRKRRSVVGAAGIGTALALAMAQSADAVSEIGQLADGRGNLFLLPLFPALGWVLFNIAQPAKNQLDNMRR